MGGMLCGHEIIVKIQKLPVLSIKWVEVKNTGGSSVMLHKKSFSNMNEGHGTPDKALLLSLSKSAKLSCIQTVSSHITKNIQTVQ